MASLDYLKISLPNLLTFPYIVCQITLNNVAYFFEYAWSIRHQKAYLSIFTKSNNIETYLIRNQCLVKGLEISRYIINKDWSGSLLFTSDATYPYQDYRIDNFHENFHLRYFS